MKSSNRLSLVLFLAAMIHTVNRLIKTIKQVPIRNERPSVNAFWDRRNMNKNLDKQFPLYKISHKNDCLSNENTHENETEMLTDGDCFGGYVNKVVSIKAVYFTEN